MNSSDDSRSHSESSESDEDVQKFEFKGFFEALENAINNPPPQVKNHEKYVERELNKITKSTRLKKFRKRCQKHCRKRLNVRKRHKFNQVMGSMR